MTEVEGGSLRKANILLSLQFLSDFGDQITTTLVALSILDITQSTGKVGSVYVFTTLGFVIFTLVGGALGDVASRRTILCCADFGRALVVLLLILAVQEKSISLIYATSFLLSILSSLHGPVKISAWAETIPSNYLERYNSLSQLSIQSSSILGPLIATFFVLRDATNVGFIIDALSFFICAIVFGQIISNRLNTNEKMQKRDFLKGFKIILHSREMKKYVSYDAIQMIGFGAFNATFLVLAQRDFAWSKANYSFHLIIVAIFTTVGALIGATQISARINPATKLTVCALVSALALYAAIKIRMFPMSSVCVGICDALIVLTMAVARTKVQVTAKHFYPAHLSSIIAARSIIIKAATLAGVSICLVIADTISLETTLTLFIIPIALSFIPILLHERRAFATSSVYIKLK